MSRGLLVIRTMTPTHPGAGTSTGAIDLMLQREVTTGFPFIQGSSVKGAMRSYLESQPVENEELARELINFINTESNDEELKKQIKQFSPDSIKVYKARDFVRRLESEFKEAKDDKKQKLKQNLKDFYKLYKVLDTIFGPYTPSGDVQKGAITISDASLLFYPVRSLKKLYALVTCPEILRRLNMPHIDLQIPDTLLELNDKSKVKALRETKFQYDINGRVYFEDLNFEVEEISQDKLEWIKKLGLNDESDKAEFRKIVECLFIVHDDVFQYFTQFATQIMSRNRIDYETGTTEKGALWTEEHLPPETYLFSYLEDDGKRVDGSQTAFEWLESKFNSSNVIHIGGEETVGKGFVKLYFNRLGS